MEKCWSLRKMCGDKRHEAVKLNWNSFHSAPNCSLNMKFSVPPNILYMLLTFSLMDFIHNIQLMFFTTLLSTLTVMNNYTLKEHYGIVATETRWFCNCSARWPVSRYYSLSVMNSFMTSTQSAGTLFSLFFLLPLAETKGRKYTVIYIR